MSCSSFNLAIRIKQPPTISDHAPASSNGWSERSRPRATNGGIDLDRALANPRRGLRRTRTVVRQSKLAHEQKREILRRWALDAYRTARTDFSRLNKVIDALIDLDEPEGLAVSEGKH
jgi:hypothetical protein